MNLEKPFLWVGSAVWTLICGYFEVGGPQLWTSSMCPEVAVECGRVPPGYALTFLGTFIMGYIGMRVIRVLRKDLREMNEGDSI